jgi:hypothetical protein
MRVILILVVIVLLMVMAGWLTFGRNGGRTSINIETQKIERDTERAVDRGKEVLHSVDPLAPHQRPQRPAPIDYAPVSP